MKHVYFAIYDGHEYSRIEPAVINYHLANGVDVYAVVINLREVKVKQQIELSEDVYLNISAHVSCLEISGNSIRLTVAFCSEGGFIGRITKEYDIDESQITRIKL